MKSHWIGAAIFALAGLGVSATAEAAPTSLPRAAAVAGEGTPLVTQAHGRHWRRYHRRHYYRHYRPRYGYRYYRPYYYGWVAPRRYYRPYYGYYSYRPYYRRPGFAIWF
ncbi:MAG TPA: hypothetical protein VFF87_06840 [Hyphomicrobium sp.]|nr:hypothetical protein [Hyphomicrobium sp.]